MKLMRCIVLILVINTLCGSSIFAQGFNVENATLQKVLKAISPELQQSALSAIYVRTLYELQSLDTSSQNLELKIKRTIINEILANSDGVKESLCDSRLVGSPISKEILSKNIELVKQSAFYYSDDGIYTKTYDCENDRGMVRKSPPSELNYLSLVLSPDVGTKHRKFLAHSMPLFLNRIRGVKVTSETNIAGSEGNHIILEGEYKDSDPERYFKIKIIPAFNYAITTFEEYDKDRRILAKIDAIDYSEVSTTPPRLWLPKQTIIKKYNYDDYMGNTVQLVKLDILEATTIKVSENMFSLVFPPNADVYDTITNINTRELRDEVSKIVLEAVDHTLISPILGDKKGQAIVSRAQEAYDRDAASRSVESTVKEDITEQTEIIHTQSRTLRMPKSDVKWVVLVKILQVLVICTVVATFIYIVCRKKRATGSNTM